MRTKSQKAMNYDLWDRLLVEVSKHNVKFNWVKWHAWHKENERCDELATNEILKNKGESSISSSSKDDLIKKIISVNPDNKNIKIKTEGQPCRKCWTPVVKTVSKNKPKKWKSYYYRYYLNCPNCKTNYFLDEAKVFL